MSRPQRTDSGTWQKYHGDITSKMHLYKLKQAVGMKNPERMEAAIRECKDAGMGDEKCVRLAEKELNVIEMKSKLKKAMETRDSTTISEVIKKVESQGISSKMKHDLISARNTVARQIRRAQTKHVILDFDKTTISEIRSYDHPPKILHRVIQAALMLLGEDEERMSDWKQCRKICCQTGDKGLNRKILDFNITQIHPDKVSKSNAILGRYRLAEVQTVSAGAATFYVWARGVIDELERKYAVVPAD